MRVCVRSGCVTSRLRVLCVRVCVRAQAAETMATAHPRHPSSLSTRSCLKTSWTCLHILFRARESRSCSWFCRRVPRHSNRGMYP